MRIGIHAFDGITMFHLAAPLMVFGELGRLGLASDWEMRLWSERVGSERVGSDKVGPEKAGSQGAGSVITAEGFPIGGVSDPSTVDWADIVIIPSWPVDLPPVTGTFRSEVARAHARGAVVAGLCLGAFAVAETGVLQGRSAVTHWEMMPALAQRSPGSQIDASVLYIDHGDVMTSAGTASSIDACLHLVRRYLGSSVATRVARSLVVAPHRDGGQAQYIERPLARPAEDSAISAMQEWALGRLDESLTVDRLAARARMSRRSFVRQFRQATGTTPARWVLEQRLNEARVLLETTEWGIDTIASECGFGSGVTFRQNFVSAYATTPTAYRRQFATTES